MDGKYEMKKVSDMTTDDKIIIRHMVKSIPDENTTTVVIYEKDVLEHYRMELLEMGLLNTPIPLEKLKIIARLVGSNNTNKYFQIDEFCSLFILEKEMDARQLMDDIKSLGFKEISIEKFNKWRVAVNNTFSYFLGLMGVSTPNRWVIPDWILKSELSIKREFLSAFQCENDFQINTETNEPYLKLRIIKYIDYCYLENIYDNDNN
jgi:intein/homing endonuclease